MRTIIGDAPNSIENQSVIDIMYRAWFFILSIGILLPLRWLPHLLPKPSKVTFPVAATAVMISCGELMLGNPTISPAGPYCPGQNVEISFTGLNLPESENIQVFIDENSTYNPFLGEGTAIGNIPIDFNCTGICPEMLGILANGCTPEAANEFFMMHSGCGFNVNDLSVDLYPAGSSNDIGFGTSWAFTTPSPAMMSALQAGTNCSSANVIAAGPNDVIPGGAIVLVFPDNTDPTVSYDLTYLCSLGLPIYILHSTRDFGSGIFSNGAGCPPNRINSITVGTCTSSISYCTLPAASDPDIVFVDENGNGISGSSCGDIPFDSINYPDIPNLLTALSYTIPAGICGSGAGLVDFYVSGMIDLAAPCMDLIFTMPSELPLIVSCLDAPDDIWDYNPTATSCAGDSSGNIVYLGSGGITGGTPPYFFDWDAVATLDTNDVYADDGTIGLFGVPAGFYYLIVSDMFGCSDTVTIQVEDAPIIDPIFAIDSFSCADPIQLFWGIDIAGWNSIPNAIDTIYNWDDLSTIGDDNYGAPPDNDDPEDITNLSPGSYSVTISLTADGVNFCTYDSIITINQNPQLTLSVIDDTLNCFGQNTGTVTALPSGGYLPYTYNWTNIDPNPLGDMQTETGLMAGSYPIFVTDALGCVVDTFATVSQPSQLIATAMGQTLPCDDGSGDISLTVAGGTLSYSYIWSNSSTSPTLMNVPAGTYTVTVTDANMCTDTAVASITIVDTIPPIIICPPNVTLACNALVPAPDPSLVTASDDCGILPVVHTSDVTSSVGCVETTIRTYTVTDVNSNTASCTQTFVVRVDGMSPVISGLPGITIIECTDIPNFITPTATDNCGIDTLTFTAFTTSGSCPDSYSITRTWTATDSCGNATTAEQIINIVDSTPPTATSPPNVTVECIGSLPSPNPLIITDEADNCALTITVTHLSDVSDGATCPQTITRTYIVTDECSNQILVTQIFSVLDVTAPMITCPGDLNEECIGDVPPAFTTFTDFVNGGGSATDNCGLDVSTFSVTEADNGTCPRTITRTYEIADSCGNTGQCVQMIIVSDITSPVMTCPGDLNEECIGDVPPAFTTLADFINGGGSAMDNCGLDASSFSVTETDNGTCPRTITRTYEIADSCGNTGQCVQMIIVSDITSPVMTCPGDLNEECIGDVPPAYTTLTDFINGGGSAMDNCGLDASTFLVTETDNGTCPRTITRTYEIADSCGNTGQCIQTIIVSDITAPMITCPGNFNSECSAAIPGAYTTLTDFINGGGSATDNCGLDASTFSVTETDNGTCPRTITRTYEIADSCGNTGQCMQTFIIEDITNPVITCPADLNEECIGDVPPAFTTFTDFVNGGGSATDNCGFDASTFSVTETDNGTCPRTITRTYEIADSCGNTGQCVQIIVVADAVLPMITCPADLNEECIGDVPPAFTTFTDFLNGGGSATDNCGLVISTFTYTETDNGTCPRTITRTYEIADSCGNTGQCVQVIMVADAVLPMITCPADLNEECIGDVPPAFTTFTDFVNGGGSGSDNCGLDVSTFSVTETDNGTCPRTITRTYEIADSCGNIGQCVQIIMVADAVLPMITCPADLNEECIGDVPPAFTTFTDFVNGGGSGSDNCGLDASTFSVTETDNGTCPRTITRTYEIADSCGNIGQCVQTIIVIDVTAPMMTCPGDLNEECFGDVPPAYTTLTDFINGGGSAMDNCGLDASTFSVTETDNGTCPRTITRTYEIADSCGNTGQCVQTIIVIDVTAPMITCPGNFNSECSAAIPGAFTTLTDFINGGGSVMDNCGLDASTFSVTETDNGTCARTITRTYEIADSCGNTGQCIQTFIIEDITNPVIACPADLNEACIGDIPPAFITFTDFVNGGGSAIDNCGLVISTFTYTETDNGTCPRTITRTYEIADSCGNTGQCLQTITVSDITLPTASNPAPVMVDCIGDVPAADINVVTDETDNCVAPIVVAFVSDVPDGASCPLTITRTYSITDACGNQNLVTQTITVNDIIPPTASNPSPIIVSGCNTAVPAPDISYVTDAADNCSAPVVAFVSDVADLVGCTETTTRTFSVTDACNNSITVEQLITRTVDNTPPVFTNPPADISVDCIAQVPVMGPLDYTDDCSPGGTIVGVETGPSGNPLTITREWTVTDDCGNVATETQIITITQMNGSGTETYIGCVGDGYSVIVNGTTYDESNPMGSETFPGPGGCDSTVTIDLTFNPTSTGSETYNGCIGDGYTVTVGGTVYNEGNPNGTEILTNSLGCDSTVTIALNFELTTSGNENYTGCTGDGYSVVVGTTTYNELNPSGTETLTGSNGCDSIVTVLLVYNQTSTGTESYSGCQGDGYSVVVNGTTYDEFNPNGIEVLTGFQGCDSTVTIMLQFAPAGFGNEDYNGCTGDGYSIVVNGTTYDEVNPMGIETFPGPGGCDSTVTIDLTFNPLGFGTETYNGCEGDGYSVVVNGTTYNEANPDGIEILQTSAGCDSTVTIDLNFLPTTMGDETYTGCEGDGYSVVVNGTVYDEMNPSGTETLTGINGCDSIVTILLTFAPAGSGTETYNGCEGDGYSVVVNGTTYDEFNRIGTEVFPGGGGCDSTVQINLVFNSITSGNETYNGCEGDGYFVVVNGTTYDEGTPTGMETLTGPNGCDSIVTINLMFSPVLEGEELYNGCEGDGYSVVVNGTIYDENNPDGIEVITGAGCDSVVTIDLEFAPFMPADITVAGPFCTEAGIQTLTASPAGGTWSGSVSSDQFDPALLGPGTHEVIYTTPAGPCQSADTIDIVVYELVISCLTIQDETAPLASDGQGQVTVSGGVPDYNVTWSGPVSGSVVLMADGDFIISSLPPGIYTIEVTDATGCTTTCQFTIASAIPCDLIIDEIITQDATCSGVDNGTATIIVSGTMIPFEYSMDGGAPVTTNVFTMLAAGPHTILVTDAAGCMVMQNFLVGAGPGPSLMEGVTVDASCGDCNGSIDVVVTGGAPPYNYSIDGIMYGLSSLFPGLCAGTYDIYLIDDGGCTDTLTLTVVETNAPVITSIDITGSSCGQSDGSITINATGGLAPLEYSIDGGANFQLSNFFDGHPAGVYAIVVRDAAGCETTGTANIQDIGAPVINSVITTPTSCGTFDGTITINASGGTNPLMYSITGGAPFQSSNFFEFLPAGNYDIAVRDANGCLAIDMVTLNTTDGPVITNVLVTHTSCGGENGIIEIIATGGTGDLSYSIDGGNTFQSGNIFDMLEEGTYDIVVIDESNCPVTDQVTINSSQAPGLDVYYTLAHCGMADGQLEVEGNMGMSPFMYSINGGLFTTNNVFVNLISDFYTLAVRDANGCIYEMDVFLEDDDLPEITDVITVDPLCGMTNGSIEIDATGDGLQYSILTPAVYQASPIFDPVAPGTYTINVRDQYGCFAVASVGVINPMPNPAFTTVIVDSECGMNSGSIDVNATSGTMPYLYSIGGPFVTTDVFTGLAAGTYTVTVRDDNNCEVSGDVVINSVGTKTGTLDTSICDGEVIIIDGNIFDTTGTYNIPISGGASNGCDSTLILTLGIDTLLEKEFQDSICEGEVYTYNGMDFTLPGQYVVDTITAAVGCDTILILDLMVNPLDTTYIDTFICTGGVFTINGMDYTMTGEYLIDTIPGGVGCDSVRILRLVVNDFNELTISAEICEGEIYTINGMDYDTTDLYTVDTLAGPGGCDTVLFLDLVVHPLPTANAGADLTLDCDVLTVTLNGSATGGSPLWTGPDINPGNETQLMPEVSLPGTYILTVTSAEGCIAVDSVVVNLDPQSVIANAGIDDSLSCDVLQITLQGSPLGPDYIYQWTGPGIDATNENLPNPTIMEEGTYTLVVTNTVTQCVSAPDEVVISDISAILIAIIQDPVSFNCYIDSIDLATVGSSTGPNIVYAWFDATGNLIANTPGLEITSGGMFTLIVEDTLSGCFDGDTVMVEDLTQYPLVDAGLPQSIDCDNPTALLNEGATNNNNNIVFQWTSAEGGILGPDTLITAVVNIPGQYYYLMATDTTNGCQNQDSVFVNDLTELPIADINIAEIITCIDESALLTIGNSSTGTGIIYVWSGPDLNNIVSETLETSVPGQYYLDVTNEATGCSSRDTALLVAPMEPQDLMATIELPFCEGDPSGTITIDSVTGGTPVYMYSINGGAPQTSPTFEDLFAGDYSIAVVDANGCVYAESFTVAEGIQLTIDIGPDIDLVLGDSVILWADVSLPWSQIDSIVWTPIEILSCTYCINPVLYGLQSDVVTATVYSGGCIDQDMLNVRVDVDANIYIPNVFSPNDDGINDYVTIFTDHRVRRIVYFEIFDRWGNQVFVGKDFLPNDPLKGWDGSFKGKVMNPAVFAYIARVELINGDQVDRKGDITIVR